MSRRILVVGFQLHDAGKTTLCKGLIHGFKEAGVRLVPFKPHSGISYWSQFDVFRGTLETGRLLSSDIIELEDAAQSRVPLEVLNPVNRLSRPVPDTGMTEEKLAFQEFIAERFTYDNGVTQRNVYYLNGALKLSSLRDMETFFVKMRKNADRVHFIRKFEDLVQAYASSFERATSSCYARIRDMPLLVESFNDAAYPYSQAEDCDTVLCVASNTILQLDAQRYFAAIESHASAKPKLQLTVPHIYAPSMIKARFTIQPLTTEERSDAAKLTENYSEIINKILKDA
jgi:predicted P-loop ATPase/GTPase